MQFSQSERHKNHHRAGRLTTRLTTLNLTMTLIPFHSMVAFWISSPTFLGDCENEQQQGMQSISKLKSIASKTKRHQRTKPRGPSLGAKAEAEPISPPTAFMMTVHRKHHRNKINNCSNKTGSFRFLAAKEDTYRSSLLLPVVGVPFFPVLLDGNN